MNTRRLLCRALGAGLAALTAAGQTPGPAVIEVPAGFEVVRVAAPPLVGFPMLGGFDERGRLFVAENAGVNLTQDALAAQKPSQVRMLEDTDGDGTFDRSTIFADQMTFPQGVLWHDGALFVASPPSIWRLEDTDDDGRADRRTELVTGFNYIGNAADVHGPFLHPNGRLYWCQGRRGHEVYQKDGALVSKGLGARIWSSRPDGTDIQVHAGGGMDNPVEVAFNQEGDVFGTVNLFHSAPRADAVVHFVHGGVYPRVDQERVLAEFRRTGDLLAPITLIGHVAPAGATLLQHGAWGPEYEGNFFFAEFNTGRIVRVALAREGSTFRGQPQPFATTKGDGIHFTDVIEDADGSLLVIDTGAWFRSGCPTSGVARPDILGGLYRVRRRGAPVAPDPRGTALAWSQLTPAKMIDYLGDVRPAVRARALGELARKGAAAVAALAPALDDSRYLVRSNVVWALTRIGSPGAQVAARRALADADFRVRQAACQSVLATGDREAFGKLVSLLQDEAPAVRREAARALGRLRDPAAIAPLADAAAGTDRDPVLAHAQIYALIETNDPAATKKLLAHREPRAQRAGLIALDQLPEGNLGAEPVFAALRSPDAGLRQAALAIATRRPQWGREAAAFLTTAFADARDPERVTTGASLLAAFLPAPEVRDWLRARLEPGPGAPALDPHIAVEAIASAPGAWDEAWREWLGSALRSADLPLAQAALRAMGVHRTRDFSAALQEAGRDPARPVAFRVAALQAAVGDAVMDPGSFQLLLDPFVAGGSPAARLQAAAVLGAARLNREQVLQAAELLPVASPVELPQLLGVFQRAPATAEIGTALLARLRISPARWGLAGADLQALIRRFPGAAENAAPMIREILNQAVAKDTRLVELEQIAAGGDANRGRAAFLAGTGACVTCHRVGATGAAIGPDLSHIGQIRKVRDLLEAIAFPEATIARGYETFSIQTRTGETLVGTIPRETADQLIVATSDGRERTVARATVAKLEPVAVSLMPAGLDRALDPKTLADLVAFLKSLQ
jgi:putative membrane-bound dehydrogenase-like protein